MQNCPAGYLFDFLGYTFRRAEQDDQELKSPLDF